MSEPEVRSRYGPVVLHKQHARCRIVIGLCRARAGTRPAWQPSRERGSPLAQQPRPQRTVRYFTPQKVVRYSCAAGVFFVRLGLQRVLYVASIRASSWQFAGLS